MGLNAAVEVFPSGEYAATVAGVIADALTPGPIIITGGGTAAAPVTVAPGAMSPGVTATTVKIGFITIDPQSAATTTAAFARVSRKSSSDSGRPRIR